jgi:hypothetical protein
MTLSKKQREELRMMFGGRCAYCGVELERGWCADHVEPIYRVTKRVSTPNGFYSSKLVQTGECYHPERNTKDNLFPCCRSCNIHKGPLSLETWRKELEDVIGILQRGYPTYRHAVRFGQVLESPGPIVFWFEKWDSKSPC